jgi:CAAX protease family protein
MRLWNVEQVRLQFAPRNVWSRAIRQVRTAVSPRPFMSLWNWTDVLLMSGATVALSYLGLRVIDGIVRGLCDSGLPPQSAGTLSGLFVALLEVAAILVPVYVLGIRRRHLTWADLGFHPTPRVWLHIAGLLACIPFFLSDLAAIAVSRALGQQPVNPQAASNQPPGETWLTALAIVALTGFVIPVAEEVIFRGVFYNWLRGHVGILPAILLSSLVFGAAHGGLVLGAGAFALGVFFAIVYEGSRSLYPGIFLHAFNNTLKLTLMYAALAGLRV